MMMMIGAFRRIRPLISQSTAVLVYNSLIQPHFDYCTLVWDGFSDQLSDKLQKLQNWAARVIWKANNMTSLSLLLDILKWGKLVIRRKKHKAIMMFKSLNEQAPVYLQNLFHEQSTDYDLRNSVHNLSLPRLLLTTWNEVSVTAVLCSGTLYPKMWEKLNQSGNSKNKSIIYLSRRILTRQSCKTVCW